MATQAAPRKRPGGSTLLAAVFVAAAGAFAWFGTIGPGGSSNPAPKQTETIAPAERAIPAAEAVPLISRGGLPTRVVVPSAGIDTAIAEVGVVMEKGKPVWETAWRSAGHHIDSALPGQAGNMVITGHVSVADRGTVPVFRTLEQVAEGDIIEVYSGDNVYRYQVSKVSVTSPTAIKLLRASQSSTVTLITCTPDLKNRLVVVGSLV